MKRHVKKFFNTPKIVTIVSLVVAILIGTVSYIKYNAKPVNQYFGTDSEMDGSTSGTQTSVKNISLGFLAGGRIKTVSVKAGDTVKKGQVLATLDAQNVAGALTQARAAYQSAKANYQKVINGASGPTVDVAKAAFNNAKINLAQVTNQQNTLVTNARRKLYSDDLIAQADQSDSTNPVITGNYNGDSEGDYYISFKDVSLIDVSYRGLESGTTTFDNLPRPLGTRGLFISFPVGIAHRFNETWVLHIPNKSGANYTNNLNAYQLALETKTQAIATAQAALDQAEASLASVAAAARPEDVAAAQAQINNAAGALQIAEAAYNNTTITAPGDGTITAVYISEGQIATPNSAALEFLGSSN